MKQQSQQTMIPYKEVPLLSLDIDPTRSCARTKVFLTFHKVASLADFRILQAEHNLGAAKLQAPKNEVDAEQFKKDFLAKVRKAGGANAYAKLTSGIK